MFTITRDTLTTGCRQNSRCAICIGSTANMTNRRFALKIKATRTSRNESTELIYLLYALCGICNMKRDAIISPGAFFWLVQCVGTEESVTGDLSRIFIGCCIATRNYVEAEFCKGFLQLFGNRWNVVLPSPQDVVFQN